MISRKILYTFLLISILAFLLINPGHVSAQSGGNTIFIPLVFSGGEATQATSNRVVNAPFINDSQILQGHLPDMAIFWYGKVTSDSNYTDVRIAYNQTGLVVYATVFDRRIWNNASSNGSNLENWDGVTLDIQTSNADSALPGQNAYRFVTQLYDSYQTASKYRASYRGTGSGWSTQAISFDTQTGWRGNGINDNIDDNGWSISFTIPFASLGVSGQPADGAVWRISLQTHDRDSASGGMSQGFGWPESASDNVPSTWGSLRFGMPGYTPPSTHNNQTIQIRQGLNANQVPDADVGGGSNCGSQVQPDFFAQWGNINHAGHSDMNIQNQRDVADWPCFSKYYVTFPLDAIPAGKVIRSATLILHEFGGSDPSQASSSNIQVFSVNDSWNESLLTWNNAPLAQENLDATRVDVYTQDPIQWPGAPYSWDVTRGLLQAYQNGTPLRLALYSGDAAYHSGKYFITTEAEDWNAAARPTLVVEYGDR